MRRMHRTKQLTAVTPRRHAICRAQVLNGVHLLRLAQSAAKYPGALTAFTHTCRHKDEIQLMHTGTVLERLDYSDGAKAHSSSRAAASYQMRPLSVRCKVFAVAQCICMHYQGCREMYTRLTEPKQLNKTKWLCYSLQRRRKPPYFEQCYTLRCAILDHR